MTHTYHCPNCGATKLNVSTVKLAVMAFNSENGDHDVISDDGDNVWDDDSACTCSHCGHAGTMARFRVEVPTTPDDMSNKDLATLLTDSINADVWTDAPECHQQIGIIQDAMAEAAHRLVPVTDAEAVEQARAMYCDDELRIDEGVAVIATDKGKWVQAWVFVEN